VLGDGVFTERGVACRQPVSYPELHSTWYGPFGGQQGPLFVFGCALKPFYTLPGPVYILQHATKFCIWHFPIPLFLVVFGMLRGPLVFLSVCPKESSVCIVIPWCSFFFHCTLELSWGLCWGWQGVEAAEGWEAGGESRGRKEVGGHRGVGGWGQG